MKRFHKHVCGLIVLLFAIAAIFLVGCGEDATAPGNSDDEQKINLNAASDEELKELYRVSDRQVEEIKALRPIEEWRELYRVTGIGPPEVDRWKAAGAYLGEEDKGG